MTAVNGLPELLPALFPGLAADAALLNELSTLGRPVSLPADHHICLEGDHCQQLALVLDGRARVYKTGETGREITLYRLEAGDTCILTLSCLLGRRPFPAWAITETPTTALVVPAGAVRRWMDERPAWRSFTWELVAGRLADIISLVEEITFRRMDERLEQLLDDPARFPPGHKVAITHREIATELGTSREVVSRLLKDLEHRGRVTTGRGWIQVAATESRR